MADEYIKREDAEKCAEEIINHPIEDGFRDSIEILSAIHNLPAADVAPMVHGKWINDQQVGFGSVESTCSNCERRMIRFSYCNFCPNCGADMRDMRDVDNCPIHFKEN